MNRPLSLNSRRYTQHIPNYLAIVDYSSDVNEGSISLDGADLKDLKVSWLRQQIGLVTQEPVLFSGSIFENIASGKTGATKADVEDAARQSNAHDFVLNFKEGYETQVGEGGVQLSGGQKQRIAIARALVRNPSVLILDEATSALDTTSEKHVQAALTKLMATKSRTTIVIAHRLSTIRNADKIVVLNEGQVVEQGTHDALLAKRGLYATLVNMQDTASGVNEEASSSDQGSFWGSKPVAASGPKEEEMKAPEGNEVEILVANNKTAGANDVLIREAEDIETGGGQTSNKKQEKVDQSKYNSVAVSKWVWGLTAGERGYLGFGLFGAMLLGSGFPLLGYFLAEMIGVFFNIDTDDMRREAAIWAFIFVGGAVSQLIGAFCQQYCFGVISERLACHVRALSFTKMLSQVRS